MVWNTNREDESSDDFEPGANYHVTGEILGTALENEYLDLFRREGPNSPLGLDLRHRDRFISNIWNRHQWINEYPFWTWWGTTRGDDTISGKDITATSNNANISLVPVDGALNLSSLELSNSSPINCGTNEEKSTTLGCSIERRRRIK